MTPKNILFWAPLAAAAAMVGFTQHAAAQTVVVEGQLQYGQPQGTPQAPPGYGVQGQVYVQPAQQQPVYAPTYATYPQAQPQPMYEDRETSIKALWIPGIIVFGVSYIMNGLFSTALSSSGDYRDWSWAPLIGPWVALGFANTDDERTGSVIGGLTQAVGATLFILGITLTRTVRVARYSFGNGDQSPELAFDVLPTPGGARAGLTLTHF